tara:strand:+ start:20290 stop:27834 length:7545 start_codon:yes stop_codon:yes gene_type:complete
MPQKTNLNISPYYDDFDKAKNYYKVLFKPGYPVQARELTGLQSILQNQVESFGNHIFKEGSMVIPGSVTYDSTYFSCKVNGDHLGIDVSIYLDALVAGEGTRVRGQNSQIVGKIVNYILPPEENVDDITIFVKYTESDSTGESTHFPNGEILVLDQNVTYGNTTLVSGDTILTLNSENASTTGSSVGVDSGVYFLRGAFVDTPKSVVILEPYSTRPSYRVGWEILEELVNSNDDSTLNDNAKGFTNFAAPGADRFKIGVKLSKKALDDFDDTNFVEVLRVKNGELKKIQNKSQYNIIRDWIAGRTYDESGNYAVNPFNVSVQNSLNDEIGSNGKYVEGEKTDELNTPNDDLACIELSPGTAYVKGFQVPLTGTTVLDVDKPRDTKTIQAGSVPFRMGSLLKINNPHGTPYINLGANTSNVANTVELYSQRKGTGVPTAGSGTKIGEARVYSYGLSDASYEGDETEWDLYLYDLQTYTQLEIGNGAGGLTYQQNTLAPLGSKVRGTSSGAEGYVAGHPSAGNINISDTSGAFISGEKLVFNEKTSNVGVNTSTASVSKVTQYTIDDLKSVFQAKTIGGFGSGAKDFTADAILYDRVLPNFSITDQLNITGSSSDASATCPNRRFAGAVGLKVDSIVGYKVDNQGDPVYNRVNAISADGATLTLDDVATVANVNYGGLPANGTTVSSLFTVKSPKVINYNRSGLFTRLPKRNVSSVDLSNSSLVISRQVSDQTVAGNSLQLKTSIVMENSGAGAALGITTAFFEPFDAERYSIHYSDGTTEPLTSDQVNITGNGSVITFRSLSKATDSNVVVNTTLKKLGLSSKVKNYIRSSQVEVTKTISVSNGSTNLGISSAYGLRVEDKEISLNVPDAVKIHAVYESKDINKPTLDGLVFVSGLGLDTNTFIGEKIVGSESRAIAQVVNRVSDTTVEYVPLNGNSFIKGESVTFKESQITANLQSLNDGNYVNRTNNYTLDKGHRKQFLDYSRIVRTANSASPSKRLLIIFDYYESALNTAGDFYTVNSYTKDRYTHDIPIVAGNRGQDILDFRPRVKKFEPTDATTSSPFSYNSRILETTTRYIVTPDESSILGYSYYLPRVDKLVINKFEEVKLIKGVSDDKPAPPTEVSDSMEVAQITYPPYLYDPIKGPKIKLYDNRRFTMRDIGKLEKRISNLEVMTSLTALELDTKSLQVKDADGIDRFKSGFVVNDFKNRDFIDFSIEDGSRCDVDVVNKELISAVDFWSLRAVLALNPGIDANTADMTSNLSLLDPNCKKTGDLLTLDYNEVDWIVQPQASGVENINPFNVIVYVGGIQLDPPSDNWTRTIYVDNHRTESTGNTWNTISNVVSDTTDVTNSVDVTETEIEADQDDFDGNHTDTTTTTTTTTTQTVETSFTNQMTGNNQEFDYVESVKISGETDPFMRSRNVYFAANGLKPYTKHIHKLDSGVPDIFPKLVEISTTAGSGNGFTVGEDVKVMNGTTQIGLVKAQAPNHKFGDISRPEFAAGLGHPAVTVETYSVDPFDRSRPSPSNAYSSTSVLFNCDISELANNESYWGYVVKGAKLIGETSGTEATVTNMDLMSDNWGDVLGAFFFRDPNQTPQPSVLFYTGKKTFRLTANTTGAFVPVGSTALASDASGTYSGTGTILTQVTGTVGVRNPPEPAQKPNEVTTTVNVNQTSSTVRQEAPYRDPLAQSFTVDETGAFLTSFDVYFYKKDPNAKVFVELREVELGTPTSFLVQGYAQVALNPNDITTSDDASIATTIKFPSPVYLESGKEYAIVFLSPGSDEYEMWVATMGQKNVTPPVGLPATTDDSQFGVVTKQYIGGSLFKSQNGTIWTPSQYQDLKFTLRKAAFVPSGTVTFYNSSIQSNGGGTGSNVMPLMSNPIRTLPRKLKFGLSNNVTSVERALLPVGRKISTGLVADTEDNSITGVIDDIGGPLLGIKVSSNGSGYNTGGAWGSVPVKSVDGNGTGATLSVTIASGGAITINSIGAAGGGGSGYRVGEILTIDVENSSDVTNGAGARFTVTDIKDEIDTLYLTDVQGEKFVTGDQIIHYGAANDTRTTLTGITVSSDSVVTDDIYSGNVIEVIQYNHGHHGANNSIKIETVEPDSIKTATTNDISATDVEVNVASTTPFTYMAGITTDRGEALLNGEVVSYVVGVNKLALSGRGLEGTTAISHSSGSSIQPYEVNGMPLTKINKIHTVSTNQTLTNLSNIDNYYLELDRGTGNRASGKNQLNFISEKAVGGDWVGISQNHQFSSASPQFNVITPGKGTLASAAFRTISGTSANGNEVSFLDQGFEPTILNETTFFPTPRMAASLVNEVERLDSLPRNASLTLKVDMNSNDPNLSPVLDAQNATFILGRNKVNSPIDDHVTDTRSTQLIGDPHGSIFVTKKVNLQQPASSIRVLVAANVQPEADFRVYYRLYSADSSETSQVYRPFPGYSNLIDTNGDGYGDRVIDHGMNNGSADAQVKKSGQNDFSEYQFTVNDLEQFSGFKIKIVMSSTNECVPVRLKDFRALALA